MIPKDLMLYNQWVLWKYEERDGRKTKVPYSIHGKRASTTNPKDWSDFKTVNEMCVIDDHMHLGKYSGIGFVFTKDDPFIGIDWDHCINELNVVQPTVNDEVMSLKSYAEISPSGTGIHAICRGILPDKIKHRANNREIYKHGRFFTVTGNRLHGTPLEINPIPIDALNNILNKISPPSQPKIDSIEFDDGEFNLDEAKRIVKILSRSKKFVKLVNGDWSGYKSQSEADYALCSMIALYTDCPALIRGIFKQTKLYRPKFDGKYGKLTINAVLSAKLMKEILEEI